MWREVTIMAEIPNGKVAFLLSDMEGSTRLWERHPREMPEVVALHDMVLLQCVQKHGGHVVTSRGEGDGCFAVFSSPRAAVEAACCIQRAFYHGPWPHGIFVRVRLALHYGEAELRDGNYYGPSVNRCARLRDLGHGGQTLLTRTMVDAVRYTLPENSHLEALGSYQLRGIGVPEQIFQLNHPDIHNHFPPLRSPDSRPNNLPVQATRLIGRDSEIRSLRALICDRQTRLVTLLGPAGCGKTHLAVEVSRSLLDEFVDGVYYVPLASTRDPGLMATIVAVALGLREETGYTTLAYLKDFLRDRRLLLVLDNFEHMVTAAAQIAVLLATCPWLKILVTSRSGIHVRGEREYPVEPLSVPDLKNLPAPNELVEHVGTHSAIELFVERARAVWPSFELTRENAVVVAELCSRLDGLPLCIELAAARAKLDSLKVLSDQHLTNLLQITTATNGTPSRHFTIRSAIDWSYDLLSLDEQQLLRRLSVFRGGFTADAAQEVCGADLGIEVLEGLNQLFDQSLLRHVSHDRNRFGMLETIQEYSFERLAQSDEIKHIRRRHAEYYLELAQSTNGHMADAIPWPIVFRLEEEIDNLRAAMSWALEQEHEPKYLELGVWIAASLGSFWSMRGYLSEGRTWLDRFVNCSSRVSMPARAALIFHAGHLATDQNDWSTAHALLSEALMMYRELGDSRSEAFTLALLAALMMNMNDFTAGQQMAKKSLDVFRQLEDPAGQAFALNVLANASLQLDDCHKAESCYRQSLSLLRSLGDERGVAMVLDALGMVLMNLGELEQADGLLEESISVSRRQNDRRGLASALNNLALVRMNRGDYAGAEAALHESLPTFREMGIRSRMAQALGLLGEVARHQEKFQQAEAHYQESLIIFRDLDLKGSIAWVLHNLAWIAIHQHDHHRAGRLLRESLVLYRHVQSTQGIIRCLSGLAAVAEARGHYERTPRLLGAAQSLRDLISVPVYACEKPDEQQTFVTARQALGPSDFERLWSQGAACSFEEAINMALDTAA
jgi:predicted ATPase/class 3 adenylate cyclase/Tfp pilus assembly protein PilF